MTAVLYIARATAQELLDAIESGDAGGSGAYRLGLINPSPERLDKARSMIRRGARSAGVHGIFYQHEGLLSRGKLAFMYPGIDSLNLPDTTEVATRYQLPHVPKPAGGSLEERGLLVFQISELYTRILRKWRLTPDVMFGHSLGEWSGVVHSGLTPGKTVGQVITTLGPGMMPIPGVEFAACGCSLEKALEAIDGLQDIEVSHDNCPHQTIICGKTPSIDEALIRLREARIISRKLDFQSGFHTSLFRDYLGPLKQNFAVMEFSEPTLPLWSATTLTPYPAGDSEALRELLIEHLIKPVRFRELTERLYHDGVRVFVQVGAGSLPGFVSDTLRGRPHLALTTAQSGKMPTDQLLHLALALFTEGADFELTLLDEHLWDRFRLSPEKFQSPWPGKADEPQLLLQEDLEAGAQLMAEVEGCFADIRAATQAIASAYHYSRPFRQKFFRTLSIAERPDLADHCLYKQKKGWPDLRDRLPIMPMTGSVAWAAAIASEIFPRRLVIGIEDIEASKWLSAEEPKEISISVAYDGRDRLRVEFEGYFAATVILADSYRKSYEQTLPPLQNPKPNLILAERVYSDGWLFHGPAYQGIKRIGPLSSAGIEGMIEASKVPGALLDNAGQLAGLWIMQELATDRYAMPIRIKKIIFFDSLPESGLVRCMVRVQRVRLRDIMFHMELYSGHHLIARIEGWEKWRFECPMDHWQFLLNPGRVCLAEIRDGGFTWYAPEALTTAQADDLAHRYLRHPERTVYENLGRKREGWLLGRIAAKDAIRRHLWRRGYGGSIFPAEIWLDNDAEGRPFIREHPGHEALYISISHKHAIGVCLISEHPRVGIDIEAIEARSSRFETLVFSKEESSLLPDPHRSEWITRFWGAKEAYAKASGRGLQGNLGQYSIEAIEDQKIRIRHAWIKSQKIGNHIVSLMEGLPS